MQVLKISQVFFYTNTYADNEQVTSEFFCCESSSK